MIYPGTDLKFRVTTSVTGFSLDTDEWSIAILDRYNRMRYAIEKDECFQDSEGDWYFTIEQVRCGFYFARMTMAVPDADYDKLTRTVTDHRPLCAVGFCDCHLPTPRHCHCTDHKVQYQQIWTTDLDDGTYLCGEDGTLILTKDGYRIRMDTAKSISSSSSSSSE